MIIIYESPFEGFVKDDLFFALKIIGFRLVFAKGKNHSNRVGRFSLVDDLLNAIETRS